MKIVIFEDRHFENFYPLTLTKALWALRCGIFSFRERFNHFLKNNFSGYNSSEMYYFTRPYLADYYKELYNSEKVNDFSIFSRDEKIFFINGAILPRIELLRTEPNKIYMNGDRVICANITAAALNREYETVEDMLFNSSLGKSEFPVKVVEYIWDLVHYNSRMISEDFEYFRHEKSHNNDVTIIGNRNHVYIEESVKIEPNVVFNAEKGPIVILSGTEIRAFSRIDGPAFVGKNCGIFGASIREGSSIGDWCKIGGEVEESIFHSYSNKYHDGFIGHTYVGEWVNLGAMTTTSDLKNNYTEIMVYLPGGRKATGHMKIGSFIGDFAKTSIGTLINTGCSIGTGAMLVYDGSMANSHIPPFAWFMNSEIYHRDWLDEFLKAADDMMKRRGMKLTPALAEMLTELYLTKRN